MAGALDHHRARGADAVGPSEKDDTLSFQLGSPGIEVADAQGHMIHQMAHGRGERLARLIHVPVHRHIIEADTAGGEPVRALPIQ